MGRVFGTFDGIMQADLERVVFLVGKQTRLANIWLQRPDGDCHLMAWGWRTAIGLLHDGAFVTEKDGGYEVVCG